MLEAAIVDAETFDPASVEVTNLDPAAAATAVSDAASTAAEDAAEAQAAVDQATKGRTAALAGVAAGLGVLFADVLNADFLTAVGVNGLDSGWLRLGATGLVVAGGTKQLHDLIGYVSKAKEQKDTPPQTGGSTT